VCPNPSKQNTTPPRPMTQKFFSQTQKNVTNGTARHGTARHNGGSFAQSNKDFFVTMDQEAILAKLRETIPPNILKDGRIVVFYRTPSMRWCANTVCTGFLTNQAILLASHVREGQTLEVEYSQGYRWPEITFTVS
jgi:hypothetical protein